MILAYVVIIIFSFLFIAHFTQKSGNNNYFQNES